MQLCHATGVERRLRHHRAYGLGGSDHVTHASRVHHSGAECRGHLVAASEHHERGGVEPRRLTQPWRDRSKHVMGRVDRRELLRRHAERVARIGGPVLRARVEQHRRGRVRRIDCQLARGAPGHERARQEQPTRAVVLVRPVPANPGHLRGDVAGIEVAAGQLAQPARVEVAGSLVTLLRRPPVHPDQRGPGGRPIRGGGHQPVEL